MLPLSQKVRPSHWGLNRRVGVVSPHPTSHLCSRLRGRGDAVLNQQVGFAGAEHLRKHRCIAKTLLRARRIELCEWIAKGGDGGR